MKTEEKKYRKIKNRYTIKYSYSGVSQYLDIFEDEDGELLSNHKLRVNYMSCDEIPSLEGIKTVDDALEIVRSIAYRNKAEISRINGLPINYYKNVKVRKYIGDFGDRYDSFIEEEAIKFFEKILLPIMKRNKWYISTSHVGIPILIKKYRGEWDNIRDKKDKDFNYICGSFASNYKSGENKFGAFIDVYNKIPNSYFVEKGLWIDDV